MIVGDTELGQATATAVVIFCSGHESKNTCQWF
jgi:hypothetical protein